MVSLDLQTSEDILSNPRHHLTGIDKSESECNCPVRRTGIRECKTIIISCVNYTMLDAFPLPSILSAVNVLLRVRDIAAFDVQDTAHLSPKTISCFTIYNEGYYLI